VINVWATWCAPCVAEFPGLVSISHRLANRDFELITISIDEVKDEAKVKEFLEKQHASVPNRVQRSLKSEGRGTNNYLFSGADSDALMQALDPQAPGPVPFTVVIAPGGKSSSVTPAKLMPPSFRPSSLTRSARTTPLPRDEHDRGPCSPPACGSSLVLLVWIAVLPLLPETKDKPLPE
jgi:thiol-disulfide isomerase/thioredoxin